MTGMQDGLTCVQCSAGALEQRGETLACAKCGALYPLADGIPLLVRDWRSHGGALEEARALKPGWYEVEQAPEAVSPWRHHLKKRRLYVTRIIERHLKACGLSRVQRLLDLGCGDGTNLSWLAPFAEHIYGSDYNLLRLMRARQRLAGATLFLADILDYPVQDNFFDIVFFNHVIEHIPDDRAALNSVHRILKPDGLLVLGTPNEGAWWWQLAYKRDPASLAASDHVHFYTADVIGQRMTEAGLEVTDVEHLGWGPPDWRLDGQIRHYKLVDDLFEYVGRLLIPRQASSLYMIATKRESA